MIHTWFNTLQFQFQSLGRRPPAAFSPLHLYSVKTIVVQTKLAANEQSHLEDPKQNQ